MCPFCQNRPQRPCLAFVLPQCLGVRAFEAICCLIYSTHHSRVRGMEPGFWKERLAPPEKAVFRPRDFRVLGGTAPPPLSSASKEDASEGRLPRVVKDLAATHISTLLASSSSRVRSNRLTVKENFQLRDDSNLLFTYLFMVQVYSNQLPERIKSTILNYSNFSHLYNSLILEVMDHGTYWVQTASFQQP